MIGEMDLSSILFKRMRMYTGYPDPLKDIK